MRRHIRLVTWRPTQQQRAARMLRRRLRSPCLHCSPPPLSPQRRCHTAAHVCSYTADALGQGGTLDASVGDVLRAPPGRGTLTRARRRYVWMRVRQHQNSGKQRARGARRLLCILTPRGRTGGERRRVALGGVTVEIHGVMTVVLLSSSGMQVVCRHCHTPLPQKLGPVPRAALPIIPTPSSLPLRVCGWRNRDAHG
jgi:hypothetical protein